VTAKSPSASRPWASWLGLLLLALVLAIASCLAGIALLLSTEAGSRWALNQARQRLAVLDFKHAQGSFSRGLQIDELRLQTESVTVSIGELQSRWRLWQLLAGRLDIKQLHARNLDIQLPDNPDKQPTNPAPWPNIALPIPLNIANLRIDNLQLQQGDNTQQIQRITLSALLGPAGLEIEKLSVQRASQHFTLSAKVGPFAPYPLTAKLSWKIQPPEQAPLSGKGKLTGDLRSLRIQHHLTSPYLLSSEALIDLGADEESMQFNTEKIALDLNNQWQNLSVAITPQDQLVSSGQLALKGNFDNYQLSLSSEIARAPQHSTSSTASPPPLEPLLSALESAANLRVELQGNKLALQINVAQIDSQLGDIALEGLVNANSLINAGDPFHWNIKATLLNLQLAKVTAAVPAVINIDAQSQGQWQAGQLNGSLDITELQGSLNGQPIAGQSRLQVNHHAWTLPSLSLAIGDNTLNASAKQIPAKSPAQLTLKWDLHARDLSQVYAGLSGQLQSTGNMSGNLAAPTVQTTLSGRQLGFQDNVLAKLAADIQLDKQLLNLKLTAQGINAGGMTDAQFNLSGDGNMTEHRLQGELLSDQEQLQLSLQGGYADRQWQGELSQLNLTLPIIGHWQSPRAAPLRLASDAFSITDFCLNQDQASLCANAAWLHGEIHADGEIAHIDPAKFIQGLPEGSGLKGTFNGRFLARGPANAISGKLEAQSNNLAFFYKPPELDAPIEFPATFELSADSDGHSARFQNRFSIAEFGSLNTRATLEALSGDGQLSGSMTGSFDELQWLTVLLPELEKLTGTLKSDLLLSGSLAKPLLGGQLQLQGVGVDIPDAGLKLRQGAAELAMDNNAQWKLHAELMSGDGPLQLSGAGTLLGDDGTTGTLAISGDKFLLMNRDELKLVSSPQIKIAIAPDAIDISGKLAIDGGHYYLTALPAQAVATSPDEQILSADSQSQDPTRPLNINLDVGLDSSFALQGFGLKTRLGGNLRLQRNGNNPPQGYGSLTIYDGLFKAYGQNLAVDNGVLIFQGPLDNPGLNMTALRETSDATVGIRIGGYAQDIRSELFSDPALSPTDTMALLVTGKLPSQMNQEDANQVMNAATALGISQSAGISNTLKETFGLDVFALQSGEVYTDSSLIVGKYLNPKLFVSYVQNLFTPTGAVQLEYSITKTLGLKAQSGKEQSIDLLYKVEHGD
jgi:translocation and assembly module TamB